MGMHSTIYVGPYIKISYEPGYNTYIRKSCGEHGKQDTDNNFCPICGKKLNELEIKEKNHVSYWDLFKQLELEEKYEDELIVACNESKDDCLLLTDNWGNESRDLYGEVEVTNHQGKEITKFKDKHKFLISKLKEVATFFEIKYGIIMDYK